MCKTIPASKYVLVGAPQQYDEVHMLSLAVLRVQAEMETRPDCGEASYKGSEKLKDKTVLITGGDSGIGKVHW